MTEDKLHSVIRRKAGAGRASHGPAQMTAARALGLSLAKAAQDGMALALRVLRVEERRLSLAELTEAIEERALLAVLEGPAEGLGLAAIAPSLLAALIEVQTTGRLGATAPPARRPTRTDAAMAAGFIDAALAGFEEMLAELPEIVWAGGFRYASYLDDPRPLGLLLEDAGFRVLQLELALGPSGQRKGGLVLALPATGRGGGPRRVPGTGGQTVSATDAAEAEAARWQADIERVVQHAPVTLDAVLYRLTLPLSAVLTFAPGSELPLPAAALEELRLEGYGHRLLAHGRLGQNRGFRAVRLVAEADDTAPAAPAAEPGLLAVAVPRSAAPRGGAEPASRSKPLPVPQPIAPLPGAGPLPLAAPADTEAEAFALAPLKMGSGF
ncbi:MAG: FliM/FliN family flagellar motor switch protein [Phaeovulum sp.]|uniref:FliM/FliN family flagellar motor switch protein n=1 Tax=Phaeovulum sp. TaxID=2934796 RepID=UPI00273117B7|nr:FliM/FliN family flagellar motor switch protein [Phaeovulum sp.]MDP2062620.1 FliM/FliN family flagellar motor switch protein [Phaeovulum sp.]